MNREHFYGLVASFIGRKKRFDYT